MKSERTRNKWMEYESEYLNSNGNTSIPHFIGQQKKIENLRKKKCDKSQKKIFSKCEMKFLYHYQNKKRTAAVLNTLLFLVLRT